MTYHEHAHLESLLARVVSYGFLNEGVIHADEKTFNRNVKGTQNVTIASKHLALLTVHGPDSPSRDIIFLGFYNF